MSTILGEMNVLTLFVSVLTVLAITLIFKTSTTTNFSHTTLATFGCYLVAKIWYESDKVIPMWAALLIGFVVCVVIGIFIDVGIFRRARHVNPVGKQIITMGFTYVLLSIIVIAVQVREDTGVIIQLNPATVLIPTVRDTIPYGVNFGDFYYSWNTILCAGIAIALIAALFVAIYKTKWGLGVRMTASNETTAQMMGVNTHVITAASWAIAAGLGCLACVFINNAQGKLSTSIMTSIQISAFLGCIVGGFNTFWGPVAAAGIMWVIKILVQAFSAYVFNLGTWVDVIVYGIAMILVLIRPTGLFGKGVRKKV